MKYNQKKLIKYIQTLNIITHLNLNIEDFAFIDNLIRSFFEMDTEKLKISFQDDTNNKTRIENSYANICSQFNYSNEKELIQLKKYVYSSISKINANSFDTNFKKYLQDMINILINKILDYFIFEVNTLYPNLNVKEWSEFYEIFNFITKEHNVEKGFSIVHNKIKNFMSLEDSHEKFLLSLGCWFSFDKRLQEIKSLIKDYNFKSDYKHITMYFKFICKKVFKDSQKLQPYFRAKISFRDKIKNIERINKCQSSLLERLNLKSVQGRSLTLYYRTRPSNDEKQMDDFDFFVICFILDAFIQGHSKIFTKIRIVSRSSNKYPKLVHSLFPNVEYLDVSSEEFIRKTSIKSNSVHFNSGSISEQVKNHSISIVPKSYKTHRDYDSKNDIFLVFLNLFYWNYDEAQFINKDEIVEDESYSIESVMCEMLRAVVELEDRMIKQIDQ